MIGSSKSPSSSVSSVISFPAVSISSSVSIGPFSFISRFPTSTSNPTSSPSRADSWASYENLIAASGNQLYAKFFNLFFSS